MVVCYINPLFHTNIHIQKAAEMQLQCRNSRLFKDLNCVLRIVIINIKHELSLGQVLKSNGEMQRQITDRLTLSTHSGFTVSY